MMKNSSVLENVEETNMVSGNIKKPDIITIEDNTIEDEGLQDTLPMAKKESTKIIKKSKEKKIK